MKPTNQQNTVRQMETVDPEVLDIMTLIDIGILILKFIVDDAIVVYANRKLRHMFKYTRGTILGKGLEFLESMIVKEDVSKFGDIIYPPLNEHIPVRLMKVYSRKNRVVYVSVLSREKTVKKSDETQDEYLQIAFRDVTEIVKFYNTLPFAVFEFSITTTIPKLEIIIKMLDETEEMSDLIKTIDWTVTYANSEAISFGIIEEKEIGYESIIKYSTREEVEALTMSVVALLHGAEKITKNHTIRNKYGVETKMSLVLNLTKESIILSSHVSLVRGILTPIAPITEEENQKKQERILRLANEIIDNATL